ncbi:ribosome small subunit-dependent GTPase A [[Acholeplasma] multilocale]|uniref:ribosome small subunit-dependent GTPase A n=1 Tax=[Acholeplasma] multilocale TaxID=264638 RepID=UPI00047CE7AE|nr:ribosome small subunit-dependent GTPase A [[Acholeplasma] multilocale]
MKGIIIKIDSSISLVLSEGKIFEAQAKGNLKRENKPCVGDFVVCEMIDEEKGHVYITSIEERKTELYRPKIVNVDQVIIVTALYEPLFASYILNKYIAMLEVKNIKPVLVFTKKDLLVETKYYDEVWAKIEEYSKIGYEVIIMDNTNPQKDQLDRLKDILENKISVFTGQTGAGKSSTLNNFLEMEEQIKTQEISKNLNRGRHTTTSVELYNLPENILIADTPGFSSFDLQDIEIEDILYSFKILSQYRNMCKFVDCKHINEIKCAVKDAVKDGEVPSFIYNDYVKMYEELKNRRGKY